MRHILTLLTIALLVVGCAPQDDAPTPAAAPRGAGSVAPGAAAPAAHPKVVVLGDSLTAGLGLPSDEAFPAVLQRRIDQAGLGFDVVNAGVSGDTSAGGLRRLDWVLSEDVRMLIVALGANDGLRGLPVGEMKRNLGAIVTAARRRGIEVVLAGMEAPPNFGAEYTSEFRQAYRELAREQQVKLIPFLLDGVAGRSAFNQSDGIHPNARGAERVADVVWRTIEPLLERR